MITITYNIDEEKWRLTGCEGIHEVSAWKCENCPKPQRKACISLLNKHPDLRGKAIQFPSQDKVKNKGLKPEPSWKEINERFERIEEGQRQFKELVDTIEKQMKEHKKKFPGD